MTCELLPLIRRPSQYLGSEVHAVRTAPAKDDVRVGLAFPDLYEIGMSHVGLAILYHTLNGLPGICAERVFMPDSDLEFLLRQRGARLTTLETHTPLEELDILGFTLAYELTYTNVLALLDLGGIPLRSEARSAAHPLVLAGGPCVFNPEPMTAFIDAFVIGEAEFRLPEICRLVSAWRNSRESRDALLRALADLEGVYVPSRFPGTTRPCGFGESGREEGLAVRKCVVGELDRAPYPDKPIVPLSRVIHDRVSIEVARGCPHGCRFCQAGVLYRPYRERSAARVEELARRSLKATGCADLSLMALSVGDYSELGTLAARLMGKLAPDRVALSLPSIRVGSLEPSVVEEILKVRRTGLTLAPEAASSRLRGVINKSIDEEEIFRTARLLAQHGWRSLKLYFMIGLPTEQDEDLQAMVRLARETLRDARLAKGGGFQVTVNVSTFVPKPHTPFQWDPQISREEAERKQSFLRKHLRPPGFRLKWHDPRLSLLEGMFARGDRSLADLVEAAYLLGCRRDGWSEHLRFDLWEEAFSKSSVSPEQRLQPYPAFDTRLPWDGIDPGTSREFLIRERERASQARMTPFRCSGRCDLCGICGRTPLSGRSPDHGATAPAPVPEASRPTPPEPPVRASQSGMTTASQAAPGTRIRFGYHKTRPASWLSHLETLNVFQRALRRAGLPLSFTEGEHPHPRLSFSPALPVGVESLGEYLDVWFAASADADESAAALSRELPQGLLIFEALPMSRTAPTLEQSIAWVDYVISFEDPHALPCSPDELEPALEAFRRGVPPGSRPGAGDAASGLRLRQAVTLEPLRQPLGFRCRLHRVSGSIPSPARVLEALFPDLSPPVDYLCRILKTRTVFVEPFTGDLRERDSLLPEGGGPGAPAQNT